MSSSNYRSAISRRFMYNSAAVLASDSRLSVDIRAMRSSVWDVVGLQEVLQIIIVIILNAEFVFAR